jgi:hypothetical protein
MKRIKSHWKICVELTETVIMYTQFNSEEILFHSCICHHYRVVLCCVFWSCTLISCCKFNHAPLSLLLLFSLNRHRVVFHSSLSYVCMHLHWTWKRLIAFMHNCEDTWYLFSSLPVDFRCLSFILKFCCCVVAIISRMYLHNERNFVLKTNVSSWLNETRWHIKFNFYSSLFSSLTGLLFMVVFNRVYFEDFLYSFKIGYFLLFELRSVFVVFCLRHVPIKSNFWDYFW